MHYAALVTVSSGMVMREALAEVDFLIEALERMQSSKAFPSGVVCESGRTASQMSAMDGPIGCTAIKDCPRMR